ncbi:hypothetical protein [Chryseobacterium sp.]|uniref:hypothetical protein n=1 Tax=Chryseobacterium sp. TaxID=1871047 RepID=UPI00260DEDC9|nr:hypothetical protein [Chryseobacterium sp.]
MSYYNGTLILLKEKKEPKSFILNFNENLKSIDVVLQKSDYEIIVFNDSRKEEEKEPIELDESMTDEDVIDLLCSWTGLGVLSYRHPDFKFELGIDYLSWDDKYIYGFKVSFADNDLVYKGYNKQRELISKISEFIDYEYIVGDINEDSQNYISMEESLDEIKEHILKNSFKIDSRNW